jgi:hypothetical protein
VKISGHKKVTAVEVLNKVVEQNDEVVWFVKADPTTNHFMGPWGSWGKVGAGGGRRGAVGEE